MRRRPSRRLAVLSLGAALSVLGLAGVQAGALAPRVTVARPAAVPLGDTIVAAPMRSAFDVVLALPRQGALDAYLAGLTSPSSPDYRRFLTPGEFARDFGAPASAVASLRAYFSSFGLRVGALSAGHLVLHVAGSTTRIARAFDAPLATVRTSTGLAAQFTSRATLPASEARLVTTVAGLSSVVTPQPMDLVARRAHSATVGSCPLAGSSSGTTPNALGGYTVNQQAALYGLNAPWAKGDTGVGQTIGIFELAPYSTGDVNTFFSCYSISPAVSNVLVDGGSSSPNDLEPTFDVEEAAALAPGATIKVYVGPNNDTGPTDVLLRIADDDTASIMSTSWGDCETDPTNDPAAEQPIFEQMAAQGQTVLAAAGDAGSSDCVGITNSLPAVDDPASQPYVTGIGGLTVSNTTPLQQSVWNDGIGTGGGAGGGGASALWPRPSWQDAPGISASDAMRMVPDISAMADPSTGFIDYFTGNPNGTCTSDCSQAWSSIGGTSVGPPLVSAMIAVATQACGVGRLGFLNPTLYSMARKGTGFDDVTQGSNDLYGVGVYDANVGYDMASGLGSPDASTFISDLCPVALSAQDSSFIAATTSATVPGPVTLNLSVHDSSNNPIAGAVVHVDAAASGGTLEFDAQRASSAGTGAASYDVTTDQLGDAAISLTATAPGAVTVTATYGTSRLTASVTFTALSTSPPGRASVARLTANVAGFTLVAGRPATSGSAAITAYQYSITGGRAWVRFSAATRTATVKRLARHTTYRVIVRALNEYGAGASSAPVRVKTR